MYFFIACGIRLSMAQLLLMTIKSDVFLYRMWNTLVDGKKTKLCAPSFECQLFDVLKIHHLHLIRCSIFKLINVLNILLIAYTLKADVQSLYARHMAATGE